MSSVIEQSDYFTSLPQPLYTGEEQYEKVLLAMLAGTV